MTPEPSHLAPVAPARRLTSLDSLRGFALLGVLVVNVYQSYSVILGASDERVARLIGLLGEGSFYPVFSLLFGLGFALQLEKGAGALPLFRRRLAWLLLIGLGHGYLVWHGDILASYALVGFLLPAVYRWSSRGLLTAALLGWLVTCALLSPLADVTSSGASDAAYASGSYWVSTSLRLSGYSANLFGGLVIFGPQLLALFLLGYALGRRGVARVLQDRRWLGAVFAVCLGAAAPLLYLETGGAALGLARGWDFVLEYLVASPLLGFAYFAGLSLLMLTLPGAALLRPFSPVGRMALSNYLGQSVVCTLLFYDYGLGLYGKLGAADTLLVALGLFLVQMIVSYLWLRVFRYGPAEWLWRSLSYGQVQPIRLKASPSPAPGAPPRSGY